jgi:DNA-binding NarL/FixJ family response regulator
MMAKKGDFKAPAVPLEAAHRKAMDLIDSHEDGCALFMIAGEVHATGRKSKCFDNNVQRLANALVGVYDLGADSREVLQDLDVFYKAHQERSGCISESWKSRILSLLEEGRATAKEIADELGLPPRAVSAYISKLGTTGVIEVKGRVRQQPYGQVAYIWGLTHEAVAA